VTAGPGNNIPTRVEPLGGARFNVTFSPRTADTHSVVVTFNDEPVRGSPFQCSVTSHEYHAHVHPASNLTGHVAHVTTSHVSHKTHIPAPPPYPPLSAQLTYSPLINQNSSTHSKTREVSRVSQSLQQSEHQLVRGNARPPPPSEGSNSTTLSTGGQSRLVFS